MADIFTPDAVQEAFLASGPLLSQDIFDLSIKNPRWLRDIWQMEEFPRGQGTVIEQLVFRGARPEIERNFDKWKKVANISGCDPCPGPDCSYNWTTFGGFGWERKTAELMGREFRSPDYCIHEVQSTAHFMQVFQKVVENLYAQRDYFMEFSIGQTILTSLAKKAVVDSAGVKWNTGNPYVYRDVGDARLATLNIDMLEFFYEQLRRMPDAIAYDVVDGSPIFSLMASHQLLGRMYRDNDQLRQDVRFSGLANDLLMKYNFMSTIRGMFIAAPILYPRRFILVGDTGTPVEVLPFVNDVPAEVGSYTYLNPAYEAATHEEVLIHGKYPFTLFYQPTETTLGENTSFGPEFSFMNNWAWINPMTSSDPFRRVGYFATSARIGIAPQHSEALFGILVTRPSVALIAQYTPAAVCPPEPVECDNEVPTAMACPCPLVVSITPDPFNDGDYIITFASAVSGEYDDEITLVYDNGASVPGTQSEITADGKTIRFSPDDVLPDLECSAIVGVLCGSSALCSATVLSVSSCIADPTAMFEMTLSNLIKATGDNTVTVTFGDCTTEDVVLVSGDQPVNPATMSYTVTYTGGYNAVECKGGISRVCVPPATDDTCPACTFTGVPCEPTT